MLRNVLIGALVLSLGLLVGCGKKEKVQQEGRKDMVMCTKCHAVWVRDPVYGTGRFTGEIRAYTLESKETCPDCKAAAKEYFASGRMSVCKACGEGALCVCHEMPPAK